MEVLDEEDDQVQANYINQNQTDALFDLLAPNPLLLPDVGQHIIFLHKEARPPSLVKAEFIPMHKTFQRRWPGWFNAQREDTQSNIGVDLFSTRWRFTPEIPQIDGNYTLPVYQMEEVAKFVNVDLSSLFVNEDLFLHDNVSDQDSIFGDS